MQCLNLLCRVSERFFLLTEFANKVLIGLYLLLKFSIDLPLLNLLLLDLVEDSHHVLLYLPKLGLKSILVLLEELHRGLSHGAGRDHGRPATLYFVSMGNCYGEVLLHRPHYVLLLLQLALELLNLINFLLDLPF